MDERRFCGRFKIDSEVKYGLEDFTVDSLATGKDLGFKGARIIMDQDLPIGTDVYIVYDLPGAQQKFRAKGKIVWKRENLKEDGKAFYEMGMNFYIADESEKEILHKYIYENNREELMKFWWSGIK